MTAVEYIFHYCRHVGDGYDNDYDDYGGDDDDGIDDSDGDDDDGDDDGDGDDGSTTHSSSRSKGTAVRPRQTLRGKTPPMVPP